MNRILVFLTGLGLLFSLSASAQMQGFQPLPGDLSVLAARDHRPSMDGLVGLIAPTQR